ncbi:MAG: hypothetical protein PVH18_07880 [Chloroflexota bacterium]
MSDRPFAFGWRPVELKGRIYLPGRPNSQQPATCTLHVVTSNLTFAFREGQRP